MYERKMGSPWTPDTLRLMVYSTDSLTQLVFALHRQLLILTLLQEKEKRLSSELFKGWMLLTMFGFWGQNKYFNKGKITIAV